MYLLPENVIFLPLFWTHSSSLIPQQSLTCLLSFRLVLSFRIKKIGCIISFYFPYFIPFISIPEVKSGRHTDRQRSFIHWFLSTHNKRPGSWNLVTQSRAAIGVGTTHCLSQPCCFPGRRRSRRKLALDGELRLSGILRWDMGIPSSVLTTAPDTHLSK